MAQVDLVETLVFTAHGLKQCLDYTEVQLHDDISYVAATPQGGATVFSL